MYLFFLKAFFEEERRELDRKRAKIRQLQQRKPTDQNTCKDLPTEIPLQLVIGTKVCPSFAIYVIYPIIITTLQI